MSNLLKFHSMNPRPIPLLDPLLPDYGRIHVRCQLVVHEHSDSYFPVRALHQPVLVLVDSALKVICAPDIEGAVSLACKDVEVVLPHILDSRLRGNDRVVATAELSQ